MNGVLCDDCSQGFRDMVRVGTRTYCPFHAYLRGHVDENGAVLRAAKKKPPTGYYRRCRGPGCGRRLFLKICSDGSKSRHRFCRRCRPPRDVMRVRRNRELALVGKRECSRCKDVKPVGDFHLCNMGMRQRYCIPCRKIKNEQRSKAGAR